MTMKFSGAVPQAGPQDAMLQKIVLVDNITTSTWYDVRKKLFSDIFQITPLLDFLMRKGKVKQRMPSGTHFEIPIGYAQLRQNIKWYNRGDELGEEEQEFMTRLRYEARMLADNVVRFYQDDIENAGSARILNYIEEILDNHKMSLQATLHEALWANQGPTAINALPDLISTTPSTGTVGGIDRSKNEALRNQVEDFSGSTLATDLLPTMETVYNNASNYKGKGRRSPDVVITTQALYEEYQNQMRALGRYEFNSSNRDVDLGMGDCKFKGAEMFYDPECPDGHIYMLNSDTMEFPYDPQVWMQMTEWKRKYNALDSYAQIVTRCNLVFNNFQKNAVIHNVA